MDCMRSFTILVSANASVAGADITTWGAAPQNYWSARVTGTSTFNIQGFKNVNIHSIEAVGRVNSIIGAADSVLVQDWGWSLQVLGQNPIINGNITVAPNNFVMQEQGINPNMQLSKYAPKMEFQDPITSATAIRITQLAAQGIGARDLLAINLAWGFNFIVNYTYEGE